MPSVIDPETLYVDDLPAIWSPVQWELDEEERIKAVEEQATASLLWTMDAPEAILRLLLDETGIQRLHAQPKDYNPEEQGDWDKDLITFGPEHAHQARIGRTDADAAWTWSTILGIWAIGSS